MPLPLQPPYPPMEAKLVEDIPSGKQWQYEPKWDGFRCLAFRDGDRIDLTPLEFQILELLASEPGRAWSRNALLDRVWSTDYEGYQRNIDPHINRLRKKLETDPKNPRYVLTVRGVGYKLNEVP